MEISEATLVMKKDTRHYAKRQLTWFKSEPDVRWFDPQEISTIGVEVDNLWTLIVDPGFSPTSEKRFKHKMIT